MTDLYPGEVEVAPRRVIAQGKTKLVERVESVPVEPPVVRLRNLDDTTAHDGKRHEVIAGKAELSTRTTVNIFSLLKACNFPLAFIEQDSPTSFLAYELDMIKLEVVTRGLAWGSYLERHPHMAQGFAFDPPRVEFFLKTKDRTWPGKKGPIALDCDDPLMVIGERDVWLHHAHQPFHVGGHFTHLELSEAFPIPGTRELLPVIAQTNQAIYEVLGRAWALVGEREDVDITFPDMKVEYGFDAFGRLFVGDVIDAESCRLLVDGKAASKQGFRDGDSAELTKLALGRAADLSDFFIDVQSEVAEWTAARYQFRGIPRFPALPS